MVNLSKFVKIYLIWWSFKNLKLIITVKDIFKWI